jgi:DNA polymerase-3 subunit beta
MDLYINREALVRALARVQGIVERRPTAPELARVLLSARGDKLRITAMDSLLTLVADYDARIEVAGEVAVDAQNIFQVAKVLADDPIRLSLGLGSRLQVRCGTGEFNLPGAHAEDFPPVLEAESKSSLTLSSGALRRLIEETLFSVSADDSRYGLNGAHMEVVTDADGERRLRFVTTDGSRLSWSEAPFTGDFGMARKMLVPRKALVEVRKLVDGEDVPWHVSFGDRRATFATAGLSLSLRLVDGDFPDYRQVLPGQYRRLVTLPRDRFSQALRQIAIVASDRNHPVRFSFEPDRVILQAQHQEHGDARQEVSSEMEGRPFSTGFNVRFFQDILGATKGDKIRLELGEALDPCIVRLDLRDDCLFVVMPMRLD